MARVLMGDFGAIVRLGLWDILEEGSDLMTEETATGDVLQRIVTLVPDVVILDLDLPGIEALARRISDGFPAVQVIACSSAEPSMRIYPPFHRGESYLDALTPARLVKAIRGMR